MSPSDPQFEVARLDYNAAELKIAWRNEHVSRYPAIWLLEACTCERCGNTQTAVRHLRLTDKPARPRILAAHRADADLVIDWGEQHSSTYDLTWLRSMCLCEQSRRQRKFRLELWGSEMIANLPYMNYSDILQSGEMLVFNNQRLMHGRTAFDPNGARRHIRSCHVDLDEFYSRLRIIYRERNNPRCWMTFRKD